jgi:hypothetical protein
MWNMKPNVIPVTILAIGIISKSFRKYPSMKPKSFPATGLDRPLEFQEAEAPGFLDNRHM